MRNNKTEEANFLCRAIGEAVCSVEENGLRFESVDKSLTFSLASTAASIKQEWNLFAKFAIRKKYENVYFVKR